MATRIPEPPATTPDDVAVTCPDERMASVAQRLPKHPPSFPEEVDRLLRLVTCRDGLAALQNARSDGIPEPATPEAADQVATMLRALEIPLVRDQALAWTGEDAGRLWRALIRYAPPGLRAPVATVLGAHAFVNRDAELAITAFWHALAERPGYSLAHTLLEVLAIGADPAGFAEIVRQAVPESAARACRLDARAEQPDPDQSSAESSDEGQ